jgi:uncharacterized protein
LKILLTGGTGLIGRAVGPRLCQAGHQIVFICRDIAKAKKRVQYPCEMIQWDGVSALPPDCLKGVEGLVHLAGESIGQGRWTARRKQALRDSRIGTLERIKTALASNKQILEFSISASGVGYYGDRGGEDLDEQSGAGQGFLAELCVAWEAMNLSVPARRHVSLRLGVVLAKEDGFIPEVVGKFKLVGASRVGSGEQYLSWIHIDDAARGFCLAVEDSNLQGVVNLAAPNPITNREWVIAVAKTFGCFSGPPVPAFGIKLLLGEMSALLLESQKVRPRMLLEKGFKFQNVDFRKSIATLT